MGSSQKSGVRAFIFLLRFLLFLEWRGDIAEAPVKVIHFTCNNTQWYADTRGGGPEEDLLHPSLLSHGEGGNRLGEETFTFRLSLLMIAIERVRGKERMHVFRSVGEVSLFFVLSVMIFTEILTGIVNMECYRANRIRYRETARKIRFMPRPYLFSIVWTLLYVLIFVAAFLFYRDSFGPGNSDYLVDTVTFLLWFNLIANKMWSPVFFQLRKPRWALLLVAVVFSTALAIEVIFGVNGKWTEFGLFFLYPLWSLFALYLNAAWVAREVRPVKTLANVAFK
jgi:benzodiazapine receptor